ncbi:class I SAM-dependent DNA methyltransferase [Barrientosiimonas humi]|uniref:class I SAM-dependent DNA methyltransferase n=1 Tax=Barrientosiimonas humi TaxID=999931 RepID=UPI00370D031A
MTSATDQPSPMHQSHGLDGDVTALRELYRAWASSYDDDVTRDGYVGPLVTAAVATQHSPANPAVLDLGCGTGLVGGELRRLHPRSRIVAADLSPDMAAVAEQRRVYDTVYSGIDLNEDLPTDWHGQFDAVVCCGTFTNGHIGPDRIRHLLQACRPGGTLTISARCGHSRQQRFADVVTDLVDQGLAAVAGTLLDAPYIREEGADYWCLRAT